MVKIREILFKDFKGCSDGHCVFTGKNVGQHTNGGCRCLLNLNRPQLYILANRLKNISERELGKHE